MATVADDGAVYVVFGAGDKLFVASSRNGGKNFDSPLEIGKMANLMLGMRRGPRITAVNDNLVVTAPAGKNLWAWRSSNRGESWSHPVRVNDFMDTAAEGLHAMAGSEGEIICAWLDNRKGMALYESSTTDGGESWSQGRQIYASPSGSICECCNPSLDVSPDGTVYAMFRNSFQGDRDMYLATRSDDRGWAPASLLGKGHWHLDRCPMDGGALSTDSEGHPLTIWRRNGTIYKAYEGGAEEKVGAGVNPWIYAKNGVWGVYLVQSPGPLMMFHDANPPRKLAASAESPIVVGTSNGDGPILAVWSTPKGEIMSQILSGGE